MEGNITELTDRMNSLRQAIYEQQNAIRKDMKDAETNMLELCRSKYIGKAVRLPVDFNSLQQIKEIAKVEHIYHYGQMNGRYGYMMFAHCDSVWAGNGGIKIQERTYHSFNVNERGDLVDSHIVPLSDFDDMKHKARTFQDANGIGIMKDCRVYFVHEGKLMDGLIESFDTDKQMVAIKTSDGKMYNKPSSELRRDGSKRY